MTKGEAGQPVLPYFYFQNMLKQPYNRPNTLVNIEKTAKLNYALKSEGFNETGYWGVAGATILEDGTDNPFDFTFTKAFVLQETASDGVHGMFPLTSRRIQTAEGETYTGSYYVRKGNGSKAPDIVQLVFGADQYANFNISTGIVEKEVNSNGIITDEGNNWWRISITAVAQYTSKDGVNIIFVNNDADAERLPSYTGSIDANIFVSGAQFEKGNLSAYRQTDTKPAEDTLITRQEVKNFMRVDYDTDDLLIDSLITAGYNAFEEYTARVLKTTVITLYYGSYGSTILLPIAPMININSVEYRDINGSLIDVTNDWELFGETIQVAYPKYIADDTRLKIQLIAGYGATDLPEAIKIGLLKWITSNYEDRQDNISGTIVSKMPNESKMLWNPYRVMKI